MECPFRTDPSWKVQHRSIKDGDQFSFDFPNGWGASVVRHSFSYGASSGKWELAVVGKNGRLNYDHPVSHGDVRGFLCEDGVDLLLAEIAKTTDETPMLKSESSS